METIHLYKKSYADMLKKQDDNRIKRFLGDLEFNRNQIIADLGCGDGKLANLIAREVKEYYGVDFSQDAISYAKDLNSSFKNVNFIVGDISAFCSRNVAAFDKIFTLDFSEHIDDSTFRNIYSAIFRSLKDSGELIIHTPNRNFIVEWLKAKGIMRQFPEHIAVRNCDENITLLKEVGFNNINVKFLSHYMIVLRFLHVFSFVPIIGKYFKARLLLICRK